MELLEGALEYLEHGFSIIPCRMVTPKEIEEIMQSSGGEAAERFIKENAKVPKLKWTKFQKTRASEVTARQWFTNCDPNKTAIGIVTGQISGVSVVDVDRTDLLPEIKRRGLGSPLVVRSGKGIHLYYSYDPRLKTTVNHLGMKGVDIRNDGAYIVAPPSLHPSGAKYRFLNPDSLNSELGPPPAWLFEARSARTVENNRDFLPATASTIDLPRLRDALQFIPADDYQTWTMVGMALKRSLRENGFAMWREWSARSSKFNPGEIGPKWQSFGEDHLAPVTAGTIFHLASEHGWKEAGRVPLPALPAAGEPQPLRRALPPAPDFPLDALPAILSDAARVVIDAVQVPPALAGQSVLAASTLAAQGLRDVEIDGRTYPLSNFFLTIAESGERKSAVDRLFLLPHRERQAYLADLAVSQKTDFEMLHTAWKYNRDKLLKKQKSGKLPELKQIMGEIGKEPVPPRSPLFIVEEPTYEGLVKLLEIGQPTVGLFSDEGGRFIGGHAMGRENLLKTAAGLSKLWDGDPVTRSRSGDGQTLLFNRRLSMHLMIQPAIMPKLFGDDLIVGQGFISRFLCSFPPSTIGMRPYRETNVISAPEFIRYLSALRAMLATPLPLFDDPAKGLRICPLSLTEEAKDSWQIFHDSVESRLRENAPFAPIRSLAAKAAEHALRLAAVFTLIENQSANTVDAQAISQATILMEYYLAEGLRLFGNSDENPDLKLAEDCLAWGRSQGGIIELTRLYQYGPNAVRAKAKAGRIIGILVEHGWLEQIEGGKEIDGRHHRNVWRLANQASR